MNGSIKKSNGKPKCEVVVSNTGQVLSKILKEINDIKTCMETRLSNLELKVAMVLETCEKLTKKLENTEQTILTQQGNKQKGCSEKHCSSLLEDYTEGMNLSNPDGALKIVPLSEENDYPHGSWLGDPTNVSKRVRCHITPQQMLCINSSCVTPEKMALGLLDKLFTREQLATSNISGKSRYGKKKLSPLFIFGIKLHLQYKFNIHDKDWQKICQNIDAKCRFAYKKHFRSEPHDESVEIEKEKIEKKCRLSTSSDDIHFEYNDIDNSTLDFNTCVKAISHSQCALRIVNATPEQIAQLRGSQEIILTEEILPHNNEKSMLISDGPLKMETELTINAEDESLENPMETHISITEPETFS